MSKVLEFPTKSVQGWISFGKTLRHVLSESEASQDLTNIVIERMKLSYKEHELDYNLSFKLSTEASEHVAEQLALFTTVLQTKINQLLISRLMLEIKLAKAQGY